MSDPTGIKPEANDKSLGCKSALCLSQMSFYSFFSLSESEQRWKNCLKALQSWPVTSRNLSRFVLLSDFNWSLFQILLTWPLKLSFKTERIKKQADKLTSECWDLCVSNPNVSKLDRSTESCLAQCVDRFIDTSTYIVTQFSNRAPSESTGFSSSGFSDSETILEDKFSLGSGESGSSSSAGEAKTKSGWKFW